MMSLPHMAERPYFPPSPQHTWEERKPIQLPSIRQAFPELHTAKPQGSAFPLEPHSASSERSTTSEWSDSGRDLFPYKRAAFASHPDPYYNDSLPPRVFRSPAMRVRADSSLSPQSPFATKPASPKSYVGPDRPIPFVSDYVHTGLRSPPVDPLPVSRPEYQQPHQMRLPSLTLDPNVGQHHTAWSDFAFDASARRATDNQPQGLTPYEPSIASYGHAAGFQPRLHSYSGPATAHIGQHPQSHVRDAYMGGYEVSIGPATKQRKRRGNLPKKTTDLLRTWFKLHLQHPYPTEDEKQELMRQTDLQMSMLSHYQASRIFFYFPINLCANEATDQISNWFINARRRQLPAMINSAKAEVGLRNAKGHERKPEETSSEYSDSHRVESIDGSDQDLSGEEEDFETRSQRDEAFKRSSV
ncbi:hypothetical protein F5884DRAFT_456452 [Xylogone sp. PMI_703]|nr:hypothetical protein F5884DRAFT_456452 [Xylogone sp. PMI_703]